ncbi:hypothetical protein ACVMGC_000992 [Bradyrhizobium barranii subsp. barranii]|uniref:hypothetical protein n=1 Tax=Bradyrhizobium TaxID=374 RepID=UPI001BA7C34D|nr:MULTISPECIES: hypothetical protein [Bradyrhizobium]MBR0879595.1 hypothetical protein [Bradyrhizobium liaoningense]MCP1778854.1 hypothetical protein [Bradyrhizobium japonicum]MCP1958148.1 hypothetical protein [Bradyrhizobium japonicum]
MMRQCGDCQLCCRLLPVPPLGKKAGESCRFQKFHKGCSVYHTARMPPECAIWNCRWLVNDDTADLSRPDRSHYVVDLMPDFISIQNDDSGARQNIQVVQIWCDPRHADAHRDPALRRYLSRRAEQGIIGLVRYGIAREAVTIIPPQMAPDGQWHEIDSQVMPTKQEKQHSLTDIVQALGGEARMVVTE